MNKLGSPYLRLLRCSCQVYVCFEVVQFFCCCCGCCCCFFSFFVHFFFPFNGRQCFTPLSQTIPHSEGTFIFTLHGRQTSAPNRPFLSARTTREYSTAQSGETTNNFSPKHSSHNGPFSLLIDTLTGNFGHEIICNLFRWELASASVLRRFSEISRKKWLLFQAESERRLRSWKPEKAKPLFVYFLSWKDRKIPSHVYNLLCTFPDSRSG